MTRRQALIEARRRWRDANRFAFAKVRAVGYELLSPRARKRQLLTVVVMGAGPTWEAAFAAADRREEERP